jgi:(1->4)-alpha-D-glucan 1-alpha-D-glucosylmutase
MPAYPIATYRVQLNKDFPLDQARALLPFLRKMGISHLYASPVFAARPGSMHGYDITDASRVNPEIGGDAEFEALTSELRKCGMGLLLDIVPNHMAASSENAWWMDLLENGATSAYASFFDVEWGPAADGIADKIFLPILGSPYGTALENQELTVALDAGGFFVSYYSTRLPLDPGTYLQILGEQAGQLLEFDEFTALLEMIHRLPEKTSMVWEGVEGRRRDIPIIKERLWTLYQSDARVKMFIAEALRELNGRKGDSRSFDRLDNLLDRQAYRIAWWQVARERMNYRRFFDVSDLIGIRQENEDAFAATHQTVLRWVKEGKVQGLRIDHIDGLHDPGGYLKRLAAAEQPRPYVVVEKILLGEETLCDEWPIDGTTGYDFLNVLNGVLVDEGNMPALSDTYSRFSGLSWTFAEAAYDQKRWILQHLFQGEFSALALHLALIAEADRHGRDISPWELRRAMIEVTACLPVYRTYVEGECLSPRERDYVEQAVRTARERNPQVSERAYDFARHVLLLEFPPMLSAESRRDWTLFVMRWQQLTGPITAKGVEDTAMYLYNRLISLNDVGSQAEPVSLERFHRFNAERHQRWPGTMNATSTHDTKRSEDVRARLNVLSEMPADWDRWVRRWSRWNRDKKNTAGGRPAPDANEEMLLYQTLLGVWPLRHEEEPSFRERLKQYIIKAEREAKVYSTWHKPDEEHERAIIDFANAILEPGSRFREHFLTVQKRIALFGALNSLSQMLIKITAPGIPDFYQGTLFWDFSLVDPDNRRPVDADERVRISGEIDTWTRPNCAQELLAAWPDGRVKAFVTYHALRTRNRNPNLFLGGDYVPIAAEGERARHVLAFARRLDHEWRLTIVPRFVAEFSGNKYPLGKKPWSDTRLVMPDGWGPWRNALTGEMGSEWGIAELFATFPVALLEPQSA